MTALIWLVSILGYLALGYLSNFILFHCWPGTYDTGDYWHEPMPFFSFLFAPGAIFTIGIYWLVERLGQSAGEKTIAEVIFFKPRVSRHR